MSDENLPRDFETWPQAAQDTFWDRIAIMREGNNIPDDQPTPEFIRQTAIEEAKYHL